MLNFDGSCSSVGTMAQVEKQVSASQNFLSGLTELPNYGDLRQQQLERLLGAIQGVSLNCEQAGSLLAKFQANLWDPQQIVSLKQAIADRIGAEPSAVKGRQRQQDYRALPYYLDQAWWEVLLKRKPSLETLEKLCHHASNLGLRNPTEPTYGMLLALVFCSDPAVILPDVEKWNLLQEQKYRMKKIFSGCSAPVQFLEVLPRDVASMPGSLLDQAFPHGFTAFDLHRNVFDFVLQQGASFPLRKTHRAAPSSRLPVQNLALPDWGSVFAGALSRSLSNLGVDREIEKELPGFKLLDPKDKTSKHVPLALEDAKTDKPVDQLAAKPREETKQPQDLIASLQSGIEKSKEAGQASSESEKIPVTKKPAMRSGGVKKRPAAAGGQSSQARSSVKATKKSPSFDKSEKKTRLSPSDMVEARASLFRKVPKQLQDRFRGGCSTCRNRPFCTLSCWAKRGYYPD